MKISFWRHLIPFCLFFLVSSGVGQGLSNEQKTAIFEAEQGSALGVSRHLAMGYRKQRAVLIMAVMERLRLSDEPEVRRKLTDAFLEGLAHDETRSYVLEKLAGPPFDESCFSEAGKGKLKSLKPGQAQRYSLIKAASVAGLTIDELRGIVAIPDVVRKDPSQEINYFNSYSWAFLLFKARAGDAESIGAILGIVSGLEDMAIRMQSSILSDMIFTKSPLLHDYVVDLLINGSTEYKKFDDYGVMSVRDAAAAALVKSGDPALAQWAYRRGLRGADVDSIRAYYITKMQEENGEDEKVVAAEGVVKEEVEKAKPVEIPSSDVPVKSAPKRVWGTVICACVGLLLAILLWIRKKR